MITTSPPESCRPVRAVNSRMATGGSQPIGGGPEALDAHIRSEMARWEKVLKTAGIQLAK